MPESNNQTPVAMDESRMVSQRHNLYKVANDDALFVLDNARRKPQRHPARVVSATLEPLRKPLRLIQFHIPQTCTQGLDIQEKFVTRLLPKH